MSMDRRAFLMAGSSALLLSGAGRPGFASKSAARARVALVKNSLAVDDRGRASQKECRLTVRAMLEALTGKKDEKSAWQALGLVPRDVVAIKVNCNNTYFPLRTYPALTYAVCESLSTVVRPGSIIIYERYTWELEEAGYKSNQSGKGFLCMGTERGGFHKKSNITRIVTDRATKIVHMPTLKYIGKGFQAVLFLKDHIGSIVPAEMPSCHGDELVCTRLLADPDIRGKNLLNICDGLRGTFEMRRPWFFRGIIASVDPIAAEVACLKVLGEKRRAEGSGPVSVRDHVIKADTDFGLGCAAWEKIAVIEKRVH
jgi:hypothetical protein